MATKKPASASSTEPTAKKPVAPKKSTSPAAKAAPKPRTKAADAKVESAEKKPAPPKAAAPSAEPSPLVEGKPAPKFSMLDEAGNTVSLADFKGKSLVLYFYPKDDTPGCTREACAFQENLGALKKKGVAVVGVSRDSAAAHLRFKKKYDLSFPLLVDSDAALHKAYGAWGLKTLYGKTSEGALRTTVVINDKGLVHRVFTKVKVDGHVDAVAAALP
jgi:thioredoxin-dependent peroxiredoxin